MQLVHSHKKQQGGEKTGALGRKTCVYNPAFKLANAFPEAEKTLHRLKSVSVSAF